MDVTARHAKFSRAMPPTNADAVPTVSIAVCMSVLDHQLSDEDEASPPEEHTPQVCVREDFRRPLHRVRP
jgi:hypothetical protein